MNLFGLSSGIEVVAKARDYDENRSIFDSENHNVEKKLDTIEEESELDISELSDLDKALSISSESKYSEAWYGSDRIESPKAVTPPPPSKLLIEMTPK